MISVRSVLRRLIGYLNYKAIQIHLQSTFLSASICKLHLLYASNKCLPSAKTFHAPFIGYLPTQRSSGLAFRKPNDMMINGRMLPTSFFTRCFLISPPKTTSRYYASRAFRILSRARNTTRRPSSRRAKNHLHHSEKTAKRHKD